MNVRSFTRIVLLGIVIMALPAYALAMADQIPPEVEKTEPADGTMAVFPNLVLHCWLVDPMYRSNEFASGIDPDSVSIRINDQTIPITIEDLGNYRFRVSSLEILELEGNTWFFVTISAKDFSGNTMEPFGIHFKTTIRPDSKPPVIDGFAPADQSQNNIPLPLISCIILDQDSGIDMDSIHCWINTSAVTFTFAILNDGIQLFYAPQEPFSFNQWIQVDVSASDKLGNHSHQTWHFKIQLPPPDAPALYHPVSGALLNYQIEDGKLRFVWEASSNNAFYRLRLKPDDGVITDVIDLSSSDCWIAGNLAGFSYQLSFDRWYQFSCRDSLQWSVAIIDGYNGTLLSPFSEWSSVILAPPNAVVIRSPFDGSGFGAFDDCPLFTWDAFEDVESYLFGIAKYDTSSGQFQNMLTLYVESEVTSMRLSRQTWKSLGSGLFIWAVIAKDMKGHYSDFMNYQFTRRAPGIINLPLTLN